MTKAVVANILLAYKGEAIIDRKHSRGRCDKCATWAPLYKWKPLNFAGRFVFNFCKVCSDNLMDQ